MVHSLRKLEMGTLENGLLGDFSGRLGNLVIYKMHGKTVIRSFPSVKQKKATGKRKQYQDDFRHVMSCMQLCAKMIKVGWKAESKDSSPFKRAFSSNLMLYRDLERPETLDWLQLSKGSRASAADLKLTSDIDGEFLLSWGEAEADKIFSEEDKVSVLLLHEKDEYSHFYSHICSRSRREIVLKNSPFKKGDPILAYVCFTDLDPKKEFHRQNASDSVLVRLT